MDALTAGHWSFTYDGSYWYARRQPEASQNLYAAVEAITVPLSLTNLRSYLDYWRRAFVEQGIPYRSGTEGGAVVRVTESLVELKDYYDQFEDTVIDNDDFEAMLEALIEAMAKVYRA